VELQLPLETSWPSALDGAVSKVISALGARSYAAFFYSRAGPRGDINLRDEPRTRVSRQDGTTSPPGPPPAFTNCSADPDACYGSYFPGVMLEALFAVVLILLIASVGVSCTFGLQSPDRFESASRRQAANN